MGRGFLRIACVYVCVMMCVGCCLRVSEEVLLCVLEVCVCHGAFSGSIFNGSMELCGRGFLRIVCVCHGVLPWECDLFFFFCLHMPDPVFSRKM